MGWKYHPEDSKSLSMGLGPRPLLIGRRILDCNRPMTRTRDKLSFIAG